MRISVDVGMQDTGAPCRLQLFQALMNAPGMSLGIEGCRVVHPIEITLNLAAVVTDEIQGQMSRQTEYPAPRRPSRRVELRGAIPYLDEGIVDDVFRQRSVTHQAFGNAQQARTLLHIQITQGLTLTAGAGGDMGFVIEKSFG